MNEIINNQNKENLELYNKEYKNEKRILKLLEYIDDEILIFREKLYDAINEQQERVDIILNNINNTNKIDYTYIRKYNSKIGKLKRRSLILKDKLTKLTQFKYNI